MNIEVVSEGFERTVNVSVPVDQVRQEIDRAFSKLAKSVRLPGFRKGRTPRKVLEARFGGRVRDDVASQLIQQGWSDAISNHGIEPVSRPEVTDQSTISGGSDFSFTIEVDVKPEIELKAFEGFDVPKPVVTVSDEEVEASMRAQLEGHTKLVQVDDRAVCSGDMVMVELKATHDDETVAEELGTMMRTESDPYYPGIEAALDGMAVGEEKTLTVLFAEEARNEQVAGKECEVWLKVAAIQTYEAPEATDELATELGFEGGVNGMREGIRAKIAASREEAAKNQARAKLLEVLIAHNDFSVPDGMIEENLQMIENELRFQQAMRGVDPRTVSFSESERASNWLRSVFAAKSSLILEYVREKANIEVGDTDLEAHFAELAAAREQPVEAVKAWFQREGAMDDLTQRVLEEKTLDWLLAHNNLVEDLAESDAAEQEETSTPEADEE